MSEFFENYRKIIVAGILLLMFGLSLFTMIGDSAIVDEIAHIPAGYSYVRYGDYRLNPEHPPLIKDLAGLPLLLFPLSFPAEIAAWTSDVNGQWEAGWHFIYHYGNNPDLILFFSRLPILLLALIFGLILYAYTRKNFSTNAALLALTFYAFSPNFLAHNHLVTTDLGIAFFIFLSLVTFAKFISEPSKKTWWWATFALAGAELAKFSAVLLIPFYAFILLLATVFVKNAPKVSLPGFNAIKNIYLKKLCAYAASYALMLITVLVLVWLFYAPHTVNFPADKQIELIKTSLPDARITFVKDLLVQMTGIKFLQPLAQYLLGVAMVFGRVSGGNTTYFLGEVSNQSFKWYFPVSYLLKEQLPFLLLSVLALLIGLQKLVHKPPNKCLRSLARIFTQTPIKPIFLLFTIFYAGISIAGNLNLGIRHLFPILPLIYVLVADYAAGFFSNFILPLSKKIAAAILGLLVFWYVIAALYAFPHYIAYFNEITGGGKNAYLYFTDSNVDWGQDLKRLAEWTNQHPQISKLKLDYFGGGEPRYFFCKRKYDERGRLIKTAGGYDCDNSVYQEWHSKFGPTKGWIAVSVTFLQNARYYAAKYGEPDYDWLRSREPYAKIGNSIFVYWVR